MLRPDSQAEPGARVTRQHGPEAAVNAPLATGGATAPSSGRSQNSREGFRNEVQGSQPFLALGEGLKLGLGPSSCHSEPCGRSLQTDTSCPGKRHNSGLAWNRLPQRMLRGRFCNPARSPPATYSKQKVCFPNRVGPEERGDLMGSGMAGHTIQGCREAHTARHREFQPQAWEMGHWYM